MIDIKRNILIEMDWIRKTGTMMTKEEIEFNVLENKIPK